MAPPAGYDVGLQHASVNGGVAVGFLLDEAGEPFREEQDIVASVEVTTAGVASVASYGVGAIHYRLRLLLRGDVLTRDHRPVTEAPATLRARLLQLAAQTDGNVRLQYGDLSRRVAFVETISLISGPGRDGAVVLVTLVDLGA